jgi:hypothetical protein
MEQKYNKYLEKLNKYNQTGGKFKTGDEIMLINDNIPGIIIKFQKPNIYIIRLVGMDYNINKYEKDISVNTRTDTPTFPFIDGKFNFNYPEFHSYTNAKAPTTNYDNRFNNYIISNINGFPSQQFLKFVNTNIFLYYYITFNYHSILNMSKYIIVDDKNKVFRTKSKKLSASAAEFNPTSLISNEEIGEININNEEKSINDAIQEAVRISDAEEDAYKYALRESILSNYSGKRLEYLSKLSFENLEKEHKQYLLSSNKSLKKHGQVLNPEEYDTEDEK